MCGIVGFTHRRTELPDGTLRAALASLRQRGPDQSGEYLRHSLSMGATRLRILDVGAGDQPFLSQDGDVAVVFNGEIFNYGEIRRELEEAGLQFRTKCDTEVVLNSFLLWGVSGLTRLRGMFAIAVWVESEGRLLLARDPMGIKPLYYYLHREEVFFGSELKAIFAHPGVPREICFDSLNVYLSLNYVPGPQTLVKGIAKLKPGHVLEWCAGTASIYPNVQLATARTAPRTFEDGKAELDHLLFESVGEHLEADVPVGIWLSGGLDSSTLLHYAAKHNPSSMRTFSITFNGRSFDEERYIRQMVEKYGTEHRTLDLNATLDLPAAIEEMSYHFDEPVADAGALASWFLAKMTKLNATVALSGEGSDEIFAGYLTYRADRYVRWAQLLHPRVLRTAASVARHWPVSDEKIGFEYKLKRFLEGSLLPPERAHVFWNGTFSEDQKRTMYRFYDSEAMDRLTESVQPNRGLRAFLEFDQQTYLPDDILAKVDRMSMAHSVEARPPFLDPRIVAFANSLPDAWKLRHNSSKHILRSLMAGVLPHPVVRRPKIGLDIPVHDWLRGPLKPFLLDVLSKSAVRSAGLFRWTEVDRALSQHFARERNLGYHLWGLMTLQLWMKRWNIEVEPQHAAKRGELLAEVGSL